MWTLLFRLLGVLLLLLLRLRLRLTRAPLPVVRTGFGRLRPWSSNVVLRREGVRAVRALERLEPLDRCDMLDGLGLTGRSIRVDDSPTSHGLQSRRILRGEDMCSLELSEPRTLPKFILVVCNRRCQEAGEWDPGDVGHTLWFSLLIWSTLDALLPLLALTVDAFLVDAVLDTTGTGPDLVALLAGFLAICARVLDLPAFCLHLMWDGNDAATWTGKVGNGDGARWREGHGELAWRDGRLLAGIGRGAGTIVGIMLREGRGSSSGEEIGSERLLLLVGVGRIMEGRPVCGMVYMLGIVCEGRLFTVVRSGGGLLLLLSRLGLGGIVGWRWHRELNLQGRCIAGAMIGTSG